MRFALSAAAAVCVALMSSSAMAATTVLNFDGLNSLPPGYGDGPGVDVSFRSVHRATGQVVSQTLFMWHSGYGDLKDVAYGGFNSTDYRAEIVFTVRPGYELSLQSFDFATYNRISPTSPFSIRTLGGDSIFSEVLSTNPGGHAHLDVNTAFVTDGLVLSWGPDAYNVGVDNISFDVRGLNPAAVPEPATWAMMIMGFGAAGALLRRRSAERTHPAAA